ncbi:MAG: GFA family protein [Alphaproteobacteria bacterium]|nr:GFA family protein [Alphaproteobacteria bacterium]
MSEGVIHTASCLCGAVKAEIVTSPKWVAHCHCPSCQKATSAAFATYAGFDAAAVNFTAEAPKAYKSSPGVKRRFCPKCGSPVSFEGETWPGEIHLHTGFIDEADDLEPTGHVYTRTQKPWVKLADKLPTFEKFPRDEE